MAEQLTFQFEGGGSIPTSPLQVCFKCGITGAKLFLTFGKLKCKKCIESSDKRGTGHSGMIYKKDTRPDCYLIPGMGIKLVRVQKGHPLFVKWYIEHYPGSRGIVGRQVNYLIYNDQNPVGIIGANSPPLHYKLFESFFKTEEKTYLNNNVFRIVVKQVDKNFGTKVLKIFRHIIKGDYNSLYSSDLIGLVTFVELPRTGAIYKADNWIYLGMTQGVHVTRRGIEWTEKTFTKDGNKKHIFVKKI